jgi:hypothetical protein
MKPLTKIDDDIILLLISNSKILKNKFIEALSSDVNMFSLRTIDTDLPPPMSDRVDLNLIICNYSVNEDPTNQFFIQLVDVHDKNLINYLILNALNGRGSIASEIDQIIRFPTRAIIYLYDESNVSSFACIDSIHTDLIRNLRITAEENDIFSFMLCNMINASHMNSEYTAAKNERLELLAQVEQFLECNKNVLYVSQLYENTIAGSKLVIEDSHNNLKANFDLLIERLAKSYSSSNGTNNINDKKGLKANLASSKLQLDISQPHLKTKIPYQHYKGEMHNNLRCGMLIFFVV